MPDQETKFMSAQLSLLSCPRCKGPTAQGGPTALGGSTFYRYCLDGKCNWRSDLRSDPSESGVRYNKGKPPYHLISPHALEGLAKVLGFGAQKYAPRNWEKGLSWLETTCSLLSHTIALMKGELLDKESGLPHVDHIQCNAMFLSHFFHTKTGTNDLPVSSSGPTDSPTR